MPVDQPLDVVPNEPSGYLRVGFSFSIVDSAISVGRQPDITITSTGPTTVRVDFARPVRVIPPLLEPSSYEISRLISAGPPEVRRRLNVLSVDVGDQEAGDPYNSTLSVELTTEEQGPFTYTGIVFGLEEA